MRRPNKRSLVVRSFLVLTNLAFMAAGVLLTVLAVGLKDSQWLPMFAEGTPLSKSQIIAFLICFGCLVFAASLVGCWGACCRDQGLLCCYNLFVVLALLLSAVAATGAFMSSMKATEWGGRSYPADPKEQVVAESFNEMYCRAEAASLCLDAEGQKGIDSHCKDAEDFLSIFGEVGKKSAEYLHMHTLCMECEKAEKLEPLRPVFEWVDKHCPMASSGVDVALWCSSYLVGGMKGTEYAGAPYGHCRSSALNLWSNASLRMGFGFFGFLVFLLAIIISVFTITRRERSLTDDHSDEREDDPLLSKNVRIY
mmetsp:Transcript_38985/g.72029  ORF Transcript_38985/g.72029 Transcript_38985/m.72029 type:complete len:310 (-) Transcript_38985:287-1216(-)